MIRKNLFKNTLLFTVSLLVSLVAAELFFRQQDNQPLTEKLPLLRNQADPLAKHRIDSISVALAKNLSINPEVIALYPAEPVPRTYGRVRHEITEVKDPLSSNYPDDEYTAGRVWNKNFIASLFCGNGRNDYYTERMVEGYKILYMFEPADRTLFPIYRFFPNSAIGANAAKIRFNDFGWGGDSIAFIKPPNTVRIAFLGASTTQQVEEFSYPDYVGHWLNEWSEMKGLHVRFEVINAGRVALKSPDFAAIMKYELAPVEPDIVVYYEGRNQFVFDEVTCNCHGDELLQYELLRTSALLRKTTAATGYNFLIHAERAKPEHRFHPTVNFERPDIHSPFLPHNLMDVLRNLDSIRAVSERINCQVVMCSFAMFSGKEILLSGMKYAGVYSYWMHELGAARLMEIKLLNEFQNKIFKTYSEENGLKFIEVSEYLQRQPSAFLDGVHLNHEGRKYHAWIVFLNLLPMIEEKIRLGMLPQPSSQNLSFHPYIKGSFKKIELPYKCD